MKIKINHKPEPDLSLLSIEAAEEIERIRKNISTNLKSTKELSKLIKKDFTWRLDYGVRFSEAYYGAYSVNLSELTTKELKPYIETIVKKLDSISNLESEELGELVGFCANLCTSFSLYEQEFSRGPCFLVA